VRLKLFACAEHRHCTIGKKVADTACCDTCVDRT
jgi:hypothetical protein